MAGAAVRDNTSSGTDEEEMEEQLEEPPCRQAERYVVACPLCQRKMRLKTLKYSHLCSRTFDPMQRALEMKRQADVSVKTRMAQLGAQAVQQKMYR